MNLFDNFHCYVHFQRAMKKSIIVKNLEFEALDAAHGLLNGVPRLEVSSLDHASHPGLDYPIDGRIEFKHGDDVFALIIEVKSNGAPRFVRSAVYRLKGYLAHAHPSRHGDSSRRLIPMVVSPYLSPESRSICKDYEVAYLDLAGNAHLAFNNVFIDRAVADRPKSETRALRSIFTPKAAAILRVMLRAPDRAWRVAELAQRANVSLGHVSNVRKALLEREWIETQDDGVVLVQPGTLLKTWRDNYRRPAGHRVTGYTHHHGKQLNDRLSDKLNPYPNRPRAIYSLNSAAQWFAPFARDGTSTFYADEAGVNLLTETLELDPIARGANVILQIAVDDTLFEDAFEPAPSIFCTSPIVTYLDLWNGGERDREAAEYMAKEFFPWL